MAKILVVDDHPLVRRGVVQVLLEGFPGSQVDEASSPPEALKALSSNTWDLVVLDISLPGRSGLDLLKEIKAARPAIRVLMLSAFSESQYSTRTIRAGAAGYLTKESPPAILVQAARQIMNGGKFITPSSAELLASEVQLDSSRSPHELLSDREYDVLLKIASGLSVGQIADVMNLSAKTVSTYRTRILTKMGLKNNAELTHYALRNGMIE
jgi:two-component system, NarL family, invasion response regulator UvrY